jgi:hypothetical protein
MRARRHCERSEAIHNAASGEMDCVIEQSLRETLTETPDEKPEAAQLAA